MSEPTGKLLGLVRKDCSHVEDVIPLLQEDLQAGDVEGVVVFVVKRLPDGGRTYVESILGEVVVSEICYMGCILQEHGLRATRH